MKHNFYEVVEILKKRECEPFVDQKGNSHKVFKICVSTDNGIEEMSCSEEAFNEVNQNGCYVMSVEYSEFNNGGTVKGRCRYTGVLASHYDMGTLSESVNQVLAKSGIEEADEKKSK